MGAKHRQLAHGHPNREAAARDFHLNRPMRLSGSDGQRKFQSYLIAERLLFAGLRPEHVTSAHLESAYQTILALTLKALQDHGPAHQRFITELARLRLAHQFRHWQ